MKRLFKGEAYRPYRLRFTNRNCNHHLLLMLRINRVFNFAQFVPSGF
ncbi:MAG: hypothetical protein LBJ00_15895 [Planctomycetaceae bacterium]|nr:hypothetical protein [Planctomycetaceae bacterium]